MDNLLEVKGGAASDIQSYIMENLFDCLDNPVEIIAGENVVIPYNYFLELEAIPSEEKIIGVIMNKFLRR